MLPLVDIKLRHIMYVINDFDVTEDRDIIQPLLNRLHTPHHLVEPVLRMEL